MSQTGLKGNWLNGMLEMEEKKESQREKTSEKVHRKDSSKKQGSSLANPKGNTLQTEEADDDGVRPRQRIKEMGESKTKEEKQKEEEERMRKLRIKLIEELNELSLPKEEYEEILREHYTMGIAACNSLARRIKKEQMKRIKWAESPKEEIIFEASIVTVKIEEKEEPSLVTLKGIRSTQLVTPEQPPSNADQPHCIAGSGESKGKEAIPLETRKKELDFSLLKREIAKENQKKSIKAKNNREPKRLEEKEKALKKVETSQRKIRIQEPLHEAVKETWRETLGDLKQSFKGKGAHFEKGIKSPKANQSFSVQKAEAVFCWKDIYSDYLQKKSFMQERESEKINQMQEGFREIGVIGKEKKWTGAGVIGTNDSRRITKREVVKDKLRSVCSQGRKRPGQIEQEKGTCDDQSVFYKKAEKDFFEMVFKESKKKKPEKSEAALKESLNSKLFLF